MKHLIIGCAEFIVLTQVAIFDWSKEDRFLGCTPKGFLRNVLRNSFL